MHIQFFLWMNILIHLNKSRKNVNRSVKAATLNWPFDIICLDNFSPVR